MNVLHLKEHFLAGEPYGSGHIHDTFSVETREREKDNYILQRLNNKIFKNIPAASAEY